MLHPQDAALCKIATLLTEHNVLWALGGEAMLRLRGVENHADTLSLVVGAQDMLTVNELLSDLGQAHPRELSANFASRFFCRYTISGQEVDVVSGLAIHYKGFFFTYPFDRSAIVLMQPVGEVYVPLMALEDWYVLYQMMPGCESQVQVIERYFASYGLEHPERFDLLRQRVLPPGVIASILRWTAMSLHA